MRLIFSSGKCQNDYLRFCIFKKTMLMRRFFTSPLLALIVLSTPLVLAAIFYPGLPDRIPIHFNAGGVADGYGSKSNIFIHTSILFVVGFGVYLLISNLHEIDPKKTAKVSPETHKQLALVIAIFLSLVSTSIVLSMSNHLSNFGVGSTVLPAVGLLLATIGYFMRNIQPNYFIGLRLPWTLEDDENWAATHKLAAKLWIPGGLVIAVVPFLLSFMQALIFTICVTLIMVIIPSIYSFLFFKRKQS